LSQVLWWSYFETANRNTNKAGFENEGGNKEMMYTGTMLEDLFAAVERAEQTIDAHEFVIAESLMEDSWFASVRENADYDSKLEVA